MSDIDKAPVQILKGSARWTPEGKQFRTSGGDYNMSLPRDKDWNNKEHRILVVIETIDSQDLREGRLLHDRSRTVVSNLLTHCTIQARKLFKFKSKDAAWAAVNFNNYKFFDQPLETWGGHRKKMAGRVHELIKELKPTLVIVFGDWAMKCLMPSIELIEKKRGWVFDYKYGGHTCKIMGTLDLQPLYSAKKEDGSISSDDDDEEESGDVFGKANLLYYVSRNVLNGLYGKLYYDLSDVQVNVKYVDNMEKFKAFWKKLKRAEVAAVDTETANGSVNHNAIHTIQFAFSRDKSYFIPVDHPDTPFSDEERAIIRKRLRSFFGAQPGEYALKYLIAQYGIFDLRILRVCLGLPIIFHKCWEIQASTYLIDENLKYLASKPFNTPHFGLEQIFMSYGNDFYSTAPFGKGDRANANLTRLDNPDFIRYGGMDVQSCFAIHEVQTDQAADMRIDDKSYKDAFVKLVLNQFDATVHVLSRMKQAGSSVDREYLGLLAGTNSPLKKLIKESKAELLQFPEIQKANKQLLAASSGQASNKGLFNKVQTVFNWGKADHKKLLFFDVMELEPVSYSKKTKQPKVDKFFIKAYEGDHKVVKKFGGYQKLTKLYSTYVKGWLRVLKQNIDSRTDFRLRPDYAFAPVVTGRLNSSRPSLQQVPARGEVAKYIKRMFIAVPGRMLMKFDYSAHEIRCWSYVGLDKALADAFRQGQKLRQKFRMAQKPEEVEAAAKDLKTKGDLHIINCYKFFKKWIEKSNPLRDAIKAIVFGTIYGKSVKTLASDLQKQRIGELEDKVRENKAKYEEAKTDDDKKAVKKVLKELYDTIDLEEKKDWVEYAQDIVNKLYSEFPAASKWLNWSMDFARENMYTYSPIGMRRNLFGILTEIGGLVAAMMRRAANSPIQGLASQIGVMTARLIEIELWKVFTKFGYIDGDSEDMPVDVTKAIHDALHEEPTYEALMIAIHVTQWVATYGVTKYYEDTYGIKFTIEPEIEMEFGASEAEMYKWNFRDDDLLSILKKCLEDQKKLGFVKNTDKAMKKILSAYENSDIRKYLHRHYPILGMEYSDDKLWDNAIKETNKALKKAKAEKK